MFLEHRPTSTRHQAPLPPFPHPLNTRLEYRPHLRLQLPTHHRPTLHKVLQHTHRPLIALLAQRVNKPLIRAPPRPIARGTHLLKVAKLIIQIARALAHQHETIVRDAVGLQVEREHLIGKKHSEVFAAGDGAGAEEQVKRFGVRTGGGDGVQRLVDLQRVPDRVEAYGGLDAAVDRCCGDAAALGFEVLEQREGVEVHWGLFFFLFAAFVERGGGHGRSMAEVPVKGMASARVDFEVGTGHDEDDGEGVGEGVGFQVGGDEEFVVVRREDGLALGEETEDVSCELYVAVACGERENSDAGAGCRLEVAGLDLVVPYYARGIVLAIVSMTLNMLRLDYYSPAAYSQRRLAKHPTTHC